MNKKIDSNNTFADQFSRLKDRLPGANLPWLASLRSSAIEQFSDCGVPTRRVEEWKYCNVSAGLNSEIVLAGPTVNGISNSFLKAYFLDPTPCHRMVFVNGYFRPDLSEMGVLPAGLSISSVETSLVSHGTLLEEHWMRTHDLREDRLSGESDPKPHAMVALNTAFATGGAVIHLDTNVSPDGPIHLIYVSVPESDQTAISHPRNLVVAESGAQATIFETFIGKDDGVYWSNALTQVAIGPGARICHYKHQGESASSVHIGTSHVRLAQDSTYNSFVFSNGGRASRNEVRVWLEEENVNCILDGVYLASGQQRMDNWTKVDHMAPGGTTHEVYKGVIGDSAHGSFQGKIRVWPNAIRSDARQLNKNLLLSQESEAASKPELEILNDDVQCAHGSTIGDLDEEALFYLKARGIDDATARGLLINAFVGEIIENLADVPIRKYFKNSFDAWLSKVV